MDYFKQKGISASLLKQYAKSPMKAKLSLETESIQSDAFTFGSCFHEMMEDLQSFYVYNADNRPEPDKTFGSKANKEWKEKIYANNELVISQEQFEELKLMVASVKQSQFYKGLESVKFESREEGYYYDFPEGRAKCKPDALYNGADGSIICVDWKTTTESLNGTEWQSKLMVRKFGYELQAVHYTEILKNVFNREVNFFFIFVEKTAPYEVLPVWVNPKGDYYNESFLKWQELFSGLSKCLTTKEWPTLESTLQHKIITL